MEFNKPTYDFGNGNIITFRSNWELNFAFYLEWMKKNKEIYDWEYEPERLMWMGGSYLPDFKVWKNKKDYYFCEVKGRRQGINKFKRAKKENPKIKFELWGKEEYNELKKKMGKILKFV